MQPYTHDLEYFLLNAPKGLVLLGPENDFYYHSNGKFRVETEVTGNGYPITGGLLSHFDPSTITAQRIKELAPQTAANVSNGLLSQFNHTPNHQFKIVKLHTKIRRH